jgi:GNAT superfamily N-acetyltransferase
VVDPDRLIGEVCMLAVDPDAQRLGIGSALTEHATAWLRSFGMRVAMIGTGADPGHAPARHTYEKADYTLIPMARYFKTL